MKRTIAAVLILLLGEAHALLPSSVVVAVCARPPARASSALMNAKTDMTAMQKKAAAIRREYEKEVEKEKRAKASLDDYRYSGCGSYIWQVTSLRVREPEGPELARGRGRAF